MILRERSFCCVQDHGLCSRPNEFGSSRKTTASQTARLVAVITLFSVTQPSASHADGFRNPFQSGAASAQGNALPHRLTMPRLFFIILRA